MRQEIKPEDLIVTEQDGTRRINHDVLESYGLFNLPKSIMRSALMVYYDNAARQGSLAARTVRTFISLASSITRFPKQVAINFTRGAAYRRNMRMLRRYSRWGEGDPRQHQPCLPARRAGRHGFAGEGIWAKKGDPAQPGSESYGQSTRNLASSSSMVKGLDRVWT